VIGLASQATYRSGAALTPMIAIQTYRTAPMLRAVSRGSAKEQDFASLATGQGIDPPGRVPVSIWVRVFRPVPLAWQRTSVRVRLRRGGSSASGHRRSQNPVGSSEMETRFAQASRSSSGRASSSDLSVIGREAPAPSNAVTTPRSSSRPRAWSRSCSRESQLRTAHRVKRAGRKTRSRRSGMTRSLRSDRAVADGLTCEGSIPAQSISLPDGDHSPRHDRER
jgi:hypothetical protein